MDVLVLGGAGQVGTELKALSWTRGASVHGPKIIGGTVWVTQMRH